MMHIHRNRQLRDLQDDFNAEFPYLKLEFYCRSHHLREGSRKQDQLSPATHLSELPGLKKEGSLLLNGSMITGEFEHLLASEYGLNVQVFRKSYGRWLQTWATDIWTLNEQNRRGRIMGDLGVEFA